MPGVSQIEWTQATWNPVTGCTKMSAGCANCYAERFARRLQASGAPGYANGFEVSLHPKLLGCPFRWRKPRLVFVNSMSDLFHIKVPLSFIRRTFEVMANTPRHTYQILTKRSRRLCRLSANLSWPENVWMGVTVERADYLGRVADLKQTGARVKFVSFEPLLGPMPRLNLRGIDWVIVGGESGPGARPMRKEWVTAVRDQCVAAEVPFFFKQWGGVNKKRTGRRLERRIWSEMPAGHRLAI